MTKIILLLISIGFASAGMVIVSLTGKWSIVAFVLLLIALVLPATTLLLWSNKQKFWQQRSTKQNANTLATIISVVVILTVINILAIRYNLSWDVSENQLDTLSPQSKIIVERLEQPLQVLVFDRTIDPQLKKLLQTYRRQNQQFQFRFINPEQEIGLARQYEVESLGEIYLKYGDKKKKLSQGNTGVSKSISETQLTNAIEVVKQNRAINIYFLQGHGEASSEFIERGLAQAVVNLEAKGYIIHELNLAAQDKIPDNADLIAIVGATRKLLAAEVADLQNYLSNGGSLLLLLSPNTDLGIASILQNWGVELDNRLIIDGSDAGDVMGFGPGVIIVDNYGDHPITSSFGNGISIFPESRPLKIKPKSEIKATPLAITAEKIWAESNLKDEEITFDVNYDLSGPLNVAIALENKQPKSSQMVIFGSSTFIANGWFEQQLNGDILLNSIAWLTGEDERVQLSIRPKSAANRRLNISSTQAKIINSLALRVMPLLAFAVGVFNWNQRR